MNTAEIIDKLCSITEEQSRIIREQFLFIRNCLAVDQSILEHFEGMIKPVEDVLDLAEYSLRRDRNSSDGPDPSGRETANNESGGNS